MDNPLRLLLLKIVQIVPIKSIQFFPGLKPLLPYYHLVSDFYVPHVYHLFDYKNKSNFMEDLDFFCKYFEPVNLTDLIGYVRERKKLDDRGFILSFDDGYQEIYSVIAPILIKRGLSAIFFVNSEFIDNKNLGYRNKASLLIDLLIKRRDLINLLKAEIKSWKYMPDEKIIYSIKSIKYSQRMMLDRVAEIVGFDFNQFLEKHKPYLTTSQIIELLNMGFYIGGHGLDHPQYEELTLNEQVDQTLRSVKIIKEKFSIDYSIFAFPFSQGNLSKEFFKLIEKDIDLVFRANIFGNSCFAWNLGRVNFESDLPNPRYQYIREKIKYLYYNFVLPSR